ncbi:MAG: presenilin family intramembrane aspartyl protease [Candidatus Nanoarchaeia archaeon]
MALAEFKPKLLIYESLLFLVIQALAILAGHRVVALGEASIPPPEGGIFRLGQILLAFGIAIVIMIIVLKFLKTKFTFNIFFALLIFVGSQAIFGAFLPFIPSIALAVALIAIRWKFPNLITHNLAIIFGVAGVAMILGISLRPWPEIILLLIALSIYDFVAVFKTKFMINLFKQLLRRGAPLAIMVPEKPTAMKEHVAKVSVKKLKEKDKKVLMLGSGDLAFPTIFAVSAFVTIGLIPTLAIIAGSLAGLTANHYLLTIKKFKFIPALPLIAIFSILAFLISLIF